jgi:Methyltransferase domain
VSLLRKIANHENADSLAAKLRKRRFAFFTALLEQTPRPIKLLDVGGTEGFWRSLHFQTDDVQITLVNLEKQNTSLKNISSVVGDAKQMRDFPNQSFDVAFSNSVIEHLCDFNGQRKMADEVRRIGRRYFVQTPNRNFPMEPHFLFPFFQFFPLSARIWIASHYRVGWYCRPNDPAAAKREVEAIRLLNRREFQSLFPEAKFYQERFFGIIKSFTAYHGWDNTTK